MRKICVVVASRANYGRVKSVLKAIQDHPALELQLIVGASALLERYGKVIDIIEHDGFSIDWKAYMVLEGNDPILMAKSTGLAIVELATAFQNLKADIVFTIADRYETMATAVAASYMNIKLAHSQGGEITGSIDESVRHAITKLAHIHFPATDLSRERLIRMGEDPQYIFKVGCPSIDILTEIDLSLGDAFERYTGVGAPIEPKKPYLLVVQHPVTTEFGSGLKQIKETLEAVKKSGLQAVWLWPNVDAGTDDISKGIRLFRETDRDQTPIHFYKNFSVEDYARILNNAACIVGNSSSGLREGAFLGVPCVNIGNRQAGRERAANVIDVDYDRDQILKAIKRQVEHGKYSPDYLYGDGCAGKQIAEVLSWVDPPLQKRMTY